LPLLKFQPSYNGCEIFFSWLSSFLTIIHEQCEKGFFNSDTETHSRSVYAAVWHDTITKVTTLQKFEFKSDKMCPLLQCPVLRKTKTKQ